MNTACVGCGLTTWEAIGEKDGYALYRCNVAKEGCGTISVLPTPTASRDLYGKNYFVAEQGGSGYVNYDEDKEVMRPEIIRALDELKSMIPLGESESRLLLDIGAATGFLLSLAREHGWQVRGVEISDYAAAQARGKGLDVITGTIADLHAEPKSFDAIILWDVIEHVPDPNTDVERIHGLLKPGGVLLLVTPDASSFYARIRGRAWHLIVPPEHINCFSRSGMKSLLARHGFEIVQIKAPKKTFPLSYSLHVISRVLGWSWLDRFSRKISGTSVGRVVVPLDVRDNMIVYARGM